MVRARPVVTCRFDPAALARVTIRHDVLQQFAYACATCGRVHWCVPALEAEGTSDTKPEAQAAADAVAMRYYTEMLGLAEDEIPPPIADHPDWQPGEPSG